MRILSALSLTLLLAFSVFAQSERQPKPLAANFTATSLDGKFFDLAELKGKVVLVTFWSTRCGICHSEIPKLNRIAERYKGKDVVFLGLTMEQSNKVESYLKKASFNFNLLPDSFGVVMKYADKSGVGNINMGFPTHFLINQNGEIELKTTGFDKSALLDTEINRLLNAK